MTAETIGKQLAQARATKGLTLDEASHLTKVRPDKLAALEHDDYTAFPNNTYARGFLQLYGRFLGVDVAPLASQLESGNPISMEGYQYLNAELEEEREPRRRSWAREPESRRPSFVPLVVFAVLLIGVGVGVHFYIKAAQLGVIGENKQVPAGQLATPAPEPLSAPSSKPAAADTPKVAPREPAAVPPALADKEFVKSVANVPATTQPGAAQPAIAQAPPAAHGPPVESVLSVEPVKTTRVRIRRNDFAGVPVFEDVLYAGVGPLRIKGVKFYVEVVGDGAVNLSKNGQPVAYQAPGTVIQ
jgi:cytoskeleton protein RodZ